VDTIIAQIGPLVILFHMEHFDQFPGYVPRGTFPLLTYAEAFKY
jgi:hypothetical protein